MGEVKHTKGPWTLKITRDGWEIVSADGESFMGEASYYPWQSGNIADAILIAAAPDLLEALRDMEAYCAPYAEDFEPEDAVSEAFSNARAAISKATGSLHEGERG